MIPWVNLSLFHHELMRKSFFNRIFHPRVFLGENSEIAKLFYCTKLCQSAPLCSWLCTWVTDVITNIVESWRLNLNLRGAFFQTLSKVCLKLRYISTYWKDSKLSKVKRQKYTYELQKCNILVFLTILSQKCLLTC